jgi:DNA helicase IV
MDLADKVLMAARPDLRSPTAVRVGDAAPLVVRAPDRAGLGATTAEAVAKMTADLTSRNVAVVVPDALADEISDALARAGIAHGRATRNALDDPVTVVPVSVVKGLELDGVVVVEPARIVSDEAQGLRALYVALTRPTQRLTIVHAAELPPALRD